MKFRALLLLLPLTAAVQAQQPAQPPVVRSPEVSADRRVTFRVRAPNASKVALAWLVSAMKAARMQLLDCQFMTEHLASLGAVEVTQQRYLAMLGAAQGTGLSWTQAVGASGVAVGEGAATGALPLPEGFALLLGDGAGASSPGKRIAQDLTQTS